MIFLLNDEADANNSVSATAVGIHIGRNNCSIDGSFFNEPLDIKIVFHREAFQAFSCAAIAQCHQSTAQSTGTPICPTVKSLFRILAHLQSFRIFGKIQKIVDNFIVNLHHRQVNFVSMGFSRTLAKTSEQVMAKLWHDTFYSSKWFNLRIGLI